MSEKTLREELEQLLAQRTSAQPRSGSASEPVAERNLRRLLQATYGLTNEALAPETADAMLTALLRAADGQPAGLHPPAPDGRPPDGHPALTMIAVNCVCPQAVAVVSPGAALVAAVGGPALAAPAVSRRCQRDVVTALARKRCGQ